MKSEGSMFEPANFSGDPALSNIKSKRPVSPVPSHVSMKSDGSMFEPGNFSSDSAVSNIPSKRPVSPVPSHVSMKSEGSMFEPANFSGDPALSNIKHQLIDQTSLMTVSKAIDDDNLKQVSAQNKVKLRKQVENIRECVLTSASQTTQKTLCIDIITEGESETLDEEQCTEDTPINCNDIFKPLPGQDRPIRTVLTKGVACIGKTVLVQKFITDWADGKANQDINFVFLLPFRLLNKMKDSPYSLHKLLLDLHPELQQLTDSDTKYKYCQILFICFALDESSLPLNFHQNKKVSDITELTTVDVLITNLIQGSLLPSARLWITSRPVASDQIPHECINKVTEVQGFTDLQKEMYFRERISDEGKANTVISHIKSSRNLHSMCYLPVFCWIAVTVLQQMLEQDNTQEIPKTLTEMLIHFLHLQTTRTNRKYQASSSQERQNPLESQKQVLMKLSELAFRHLEKGSFMFSEEEVRACGLDVNDALVHSGLCTDVLKGESYRFGKMYTFVHVTIQEFLAALYVFASYINKNEETLKILLKGKFKISMKHTSLDELLKNAMNRALESKSGHLDLFVRFLHGISMESNQRLLQGLLTNTQSNSESIKKAIQNLKALRRPNISPDRWINVLNCLVEMHDSSLHEKVQGLLKSGEHNVKKLKLTLCSAWANMLLMSDEPIDELNLKNFRTSAEGRRRLIPIVRCCKKALLVDCKLTEKCCEVVASALESVHSHLKVLDLSNNNLQKSEERLFKTLQSKHCKLESLRLVHCKLLGKSCKILSTGLQSSTTALRELDLSDNNLQDSVTPIFSAIPNCKLEILSLAGCRFTVSSCKALALALQVQVSPLRELDLSRNPLKDSGVEILSSGLKSPHCCLEKLRLSFCGVTKKGCEFLASALNANPSYLRELDLSDNHLGEEGLKLLMAIKEDSNTALETLTNGYNTSSLL